MIVVLDTDKDDAALDRLADVLAARIKNKDACDIAFVEQQLNLKSCIN